MDRLIIPRSLRLRSMDGRGPRTEEGGQDESDSIRLSVLTASRVETYSLLTLMAFSRLPREGGREGGLMQQFMLRLAETIQLLIRP